MSHQDNPCLGCREGAHVHDGRTHLLESGQRIECTGGTHWLRGRLSLNAGEVFDLACDLIAPAKPGMVTVRVYGRVRKTRTCTVYSWISTVAADRVREKHIPADPGWVTPKP